MKYIKKIKPFTKTLSNPPYVYSEVNCTEFNGIYSQVCVECIGPPRSLLFPLESHCSNVSVMPTLAALTNSTWNCPHPVEDPRAKGKIAPQIRISGVSSQSLKTSACSGGTLDSQISVVPCVTLNLSAQFYSISVAPPATQHLVWLNQLRYPKAASAV